MSLGELHIDAAVALLSKAKEKFPIFSKLGESDATNGEDVGKFQVVNERRNMCIN